jgi:hypothetical protein
VFGYAVWFGEANHAKLLPRQARSEYNQGIAKVDHMIETCKEKGLTFAAAKAHSSRHES